MVNVFTIESEFESAQRLGFPTYTSFKKTFEEHNKDVNVRWGNSGKIEDKTGRVRDFDMVINPSSKIRDNCRKHEALKRMSKIVLTPKMYEKYVPDGSLVVVRPIEHAGGSDFSVKRGPLDLDYGYEYATDYIKTKTEYRVWFINGRTMCARRARSADKSEYPCRSEWGYEFCDISPILHEQTLKAANLIGLDAGAADILSKNGHYYFLELNSAPSVDLMRIENFFRYNLEDLIFKKFPNVSLYE